MFQTAVDDPLGTAILYGKRIISNMNQSFPGVCFFVGFDLIHVLIDTEQCETGYYHTLHNPWLRYSMSFREARWSWVGLGMISVVDIMPWGAGVLLPRTPTGYMFTHVLIDTAQRETGYYQSCYNP